MFDIFLLSEHKSLIQAILTSIIVAVALKKEIKDPCEKMMKEVCRKINTTYVSGIPVGDMTYVAKEGYENRDYSETLTSTAIVNATYGFLLLICAEQENIGIFPLVTLILCGVITLLFVFMYKLKILNNSCIGWPWNKRFIFDKEHAYMPISIFISIMETFLFVVVFVLSVFNIIPNYNCILLKYILNIAAFVVLFVPLLAIMIKWQDMPKKAKRSFDKIDKLLQCKTKISIEERLNELFKDMDKKWGQNFFFNNAKHYLEMDSLYITTEDLDFIVEKSGCVKNNYTITKEISDNQKNSIVGIIEKSSLNKIYQYRLKKIAKNRPAVKLNLKDNKVDGRCEDELKTLCEKLCKWGFLNIESPQIES